MTKRTFAERVSKAEEIILDTLMRNAAFTAKAYGDGSICHEPMPLAILQQALTEARINPTDGERALKHLLSTKMAYCRGVQEDDTQVSITPKGMSYYNQHIATRNTIWH